MIISDGNGVTVLRIDESDGKLEASLTFKPTIDRLIEIQRRMEDDALKVAVIQYLRNEGYTIIPPEV